MQILATKIDALILKNYCLLFSTSDSVRVGEKWGIRYKIKKSTLEIVGDDSILLRRIVSGFSL